jgi:hypothetical protein
MDVYSLGATLHYMLTGCLPPLKGPLSWPPLLTDWPHLRASVAAQHSRKRGGAALGIGLGSSADSIQQRNDTASRLVVAAAAKAAAKAAPQSLAYRLRSLAGRVDALLTKHNPVTALTQQQEDNRGVGRLFNRFSRVAAVAVACGC